MFEGGFPSKSTQQWGVFVLSIFGVSSSTEAKRLWASCKSCGSVMATPEGFETMKRLGLANVNVSVMIQK